MKQITSNTVLKQEDRLYSGIETSQGIVWVDESAKKEVFDRVWNSDVKKILTVSDVFMPHGFKIIAASFGLGGVPKITIDCDYKNLAHKIRMKNFGDDIGQGIKNSAREEGIILGLKANKSGYTQENIIQAAIKYASCFNTFMKIETNKGLSYSDAEKLWWGTYLESLNSIKEIVVDKTFKVIEIL